MSRPTKKGVKKSAKSVTSSGIHSVGFADEERAAMKARTQELKAEARSNRNKAEGENEVLTAISAMPGPERAIAKKIHGIIMAGAPSLSPKTWYGMPAYARDGRVVCFYQSAQKFKTRYGTLGFSDQANLDDGNMWPTAFAITHLTAEVQAKIVELLQKAVG